MYVLWVPSVKLALFRKCGGKKEKKPRPPLQMSSDDVFGDVSALPAALAAEAWAQGLRDGSLQVSFVRLQPASLLLPKQ